MFYGYDQGVMSQVNLNPDYQSHMDILPVKGEERTYQATQPILTLEYRESTARRSFRRNCLRILHWHTDRRPRSWLLG